MSDKTVLDVKGLNCPQPLVKAKKALNDIAVGTMLEVHATDPGSVADFDAFCRKTGHELVSKAEEGSVHIITLKRMK